MSIDEKSTGISVKPNQAAADAFASVFTEPPSVPASGSLSIFAQFPFAAWAIFDQEASFSSEVGRRVVKSAIHLQISYV